ncbi:intein [Streptomyces sp. Ag109_G2-6]|uniref:polymorphic toxin-type HINT domain-containing protein n=1 Tax=Streptomyces TaxID=1883 RepID=UPI0009A53476|nr:MULTISPECIES: polymorphic toxin-type HINT domain-containing protein [Streptomyces]RPF46309.1 intein [Streptomyces sp. Ag109_G2-6]
MNQRLSQKIVTFFTVLCLAIGSGVGTAAAAGPPEREPTLLEIAAKVEQYSKCRQKPLLQRPQCRKDFALRSAEIALAVGLFLYVSMPAMKDNGAAFTGVKKELGALVDQLKPLLDEANHENADPERRREIFRQVATTYKAARPNLDKIRADMIAVSRMLDVTGDLSPELLAAFTVIAGDYFPKEKEKPIEPPKGGPSWDIWADLKELGKAVDQINAGLAQMNEALDEMNDTMVVVNESIDGINKGLDQANRGMDQLNAGVGQMNEGLGQVNTSVADFNKAADSILVPDLKFDFDFSHVGESIGAAKTPEQAAAQDEQDRRMGMLLDLLPGISDGKGVIDALTGKDMVTGEHLSPVDRALGATVVLKWLKYGGKLVPEDIRAARRGRKVPCKTNSFPAGTLVLRGDGTAAPIQQIKIGDAVLATDPATGATGPRRVDSTIYTPDDRDFTRITLGPGAGRGSLTATAHHPFWSTKSKQWTDAGDLNVGDTLRTADGSTVEIATVTRWKGLQPAYNLTVNDLHTYYVLAGSTPVLVHNASCDFIPGDIPDASAIDRGSLVKLREKQLENALEGLGEDPHGFKADWVGKNNVSRFDAVRDGDGRIVLMSKDGKILVPTNYRFRP